MKSHRPLLQALLAMVLASCLGISLGADGAARRKVIIDQDAWGPAGSNMQAILMLLQAKDVEVLGITIPTATGGGMRKSPTPCACSMWTYPSSSGSRSNC